MDTRRPYLRTFGFGAIWFGCVAVTMLSRHPGDWASYPPRNFVVLIVAWVLTALLLGWVATRFEWLRCWVAVGLGTLVGSLVVLGSMLLIVQRAYQPAAPANFKNTDEMMVYLAGEAAKWVKADRDIELDYSVESIKVVEEELSRIAKEINRENPQQGTFGTAMGYGAYVGETFRRRDGGSWTTDHPTGGERSFPLTLKSNTVIFPVAWCWKRLVNGEEDNVYHKALLFESAGGLEFPATNQANDKVLTVWPTNTPK